MAATPSRWWRWELNQMRFPITIQGDTSTNYAADVITVGMTGDITGLVIKGQGGGDTITLSGGTQSSLIQGNGGADSISITQSYSGQDVVIGGGAGATPST